VQLQLQVQGSLLAASCVQMLLGGTGAIGVIIRYVGTSRTVFFIAFPRQVH
jgi:hypothetical protein